MLYCLNYYNPHYNKKFYTQLFDLAGLNRMIKKCIELQCTIIGVQCFTENVDPDDFGGELIW